MVIFFQKCTVRESGDTGDPDLHEIYLLEQTCQYGQVYKQKVHPVLSSTAVC